MNHGEAEGQGREEIEGPDKQPLWSYPAELPEFSPSGGHILHINFLRCQNVPGLPDSVTFR